MIYLASPYSHSNPEVQEDRYNEACDCAVWLTQRGYVVYSPIASWHVIARHYALPTSYDFWKKVNNDFINLAEAVYLLDIPGWKDSRGVQEEIKFARAINVKICMIVPLETGEYTIHQNFGDAQRVFGL